MSLPIMLRTGKILDLDGIDPDLITLEEIANSLSKQCRYGGKCEEFYSVAQHSAICAYYVHPDFMLEALMHDAGEGILQDIIYPYKQLCPALGKYEDVVCDIIADKLGMVNGFQHLPEVKKIDQQCFVTEFHSLFEQNYLLANLEEVEKIKEIFKEPFSNGSLVDSVGVKLREQEENCKFDDVIITDFWEPQLAYTNFINSFEDLTGRRYL
jgi:uncharacterized protein YoaH (UPF0181 family)